MTQACSLDRRARVVEAIDAGRRCRSAAAQLGLAPTAALKWHPLSRETGPRHAARKAAACARAILRRSARRSSRFSRRPCTSRPLRSPSGLGPHRARASRLRRCTIRHRDHAARKPCSRRSETWTEIRLSFPMRMSHRGAVGPGPMANAKRNCGSVRTAAPQRAPAIPQRHWCITTFVAGLRLGGRRL